MYNMYMWGDTILEYRTRVFVSMLPPIILQFSLGVACSMNYILSGVLLFLNYGLQDNFLKCYHDFTMTWFNYSKSIKYKFS